MAKGICYRCGAPGTSKEHFPPKAFFPRGANLQLRTVRSCELHNTAKSGDDQYLLAHICAAAAKEDNLPAQVFMRSIAPQLKMSPGLAASLRPDPQRGRGAIPVDGVRFDSFFDALSCAIYFDRFKSPFDSDVHWLRHIYPTLDHGDRRANAAAREARDTFSQFFELHGGLVEKFEADRIDEVVYGHTIAAPAGNRASITIAHTFYGVFEVISLMTYDPSGFNRRRTAGYRSRDISALTPRN